MIEQTTSLPIAMTIGEKGAFWLEMGFSIFPVGPDKEPFFSWKIYQDRQPTSGEVAEWCRLRPDLQWGICTGPISNLTVVDTDSPEASAAVRALLPADPETVTVQTVSPGHEQFWFQCDLDIPQTATKKKLHPDPAEWIDIRNLGGYVLAPGSKAYKKDAQGNLTAELGYSRFNLSRDKTRTTAEFIKTRSRISPELKASLLATRPTNANGSAPPPFFPPIKEGEKVAVGLRESFLFNKALQLVDDGLPRSMIEQNISTLVSEYCEPGDSPSAAAKVESAYKWREKHPKPAAEEVYDLNDVLLTGSQIRALEVHVLWRIDRLIPERGVTLVHGAGGLGKTWLAFAMSKAVSEGLPFLGLTTKQCSVVYVDYENPWPVFHEKALKRGLLDTFKAWHLSYAHRPPRLDSKSWAKYKELDPGSLVFFDSSRSCHAGKGNDDAAALVMTRLKELSEERNQSAVLLHHTPRANERQAKGSTAWEDLADQVLAFYPVNRNTREELAEGGEFDPDALLYLGTGVKSRFERIRLFVTLNVETGEFTLADDPNGEVIKTLAEYIAGPGNDQNQTELRAWAKTQGIGPKTKPAFISLLNRGERERFWKSRQDGASKRYSNEQM